MAQANSNSSAKPDCFPEELVTRIAAMLEAGDVDAALRALGLDPNAFPEVAS